MKWIKKSRSLEKDLKSITNIGKRCKIIREAKNRISDFKGEFGFRQVAEMLFKAGVLPEGTKGRKVLKEFEEGHRKFSSDHRLVSVLIKLLDVKEEFITGSNKPDEGVAAVTETKKEVIRPSLVGASKHKSGKSLAVTLVNKTEESHSFYFKYYPKDNALIIQLYGDEPVPTSDKSKSEHGRQTAELWSPGMMPKYTSSEKTKFIPSEEMVTI